MSAKGVERIASAAKRAAQLTPSILEGDGLKELFSRFTFALNEGFNLLCYGFGSKHKILNQFGSEVCSKHGHIVVFQTRLRHQGSAIVYRIPAPSSKSTCRARTIWWIKALSGS